MHLGWKIKMHLLKETVLFNYFYFMKIAVPIISYYFPSPDTHGIKDS